MYIIKHYIFSFVIADENNQALRLRNGIATIIKLHLKSNMSQDIIPIHISSDKSNYFPNNKNNSFIFDFEKNDKLSGNFWNFWAIFRKKVLDIKLQISKISENSL